MALFGGVSLIVLATDEVESLAKTVRIILSTCRHSDISEIFILVCDKTTEECLKTAERIRSESSDVRIIIKKQSTAFIGEAFHETLFCCTGTHCIVVGADMDTDPKIVSEFVESAKKTPDSVIVASRWIKGGGFDGYNHVVYVKNYLAQKFIKLLFHTRLTDFTYSYRIVPLKYLLSLTWDSTGRSIGLENMLKFMRLGYDIYEIPVVWHNRTEGKSDRRIRDDFYYIKTIFSVRFAKKSALINRTNEK